MVGRVTASRLAVIKKICLRTPSGFYALDAFKSDLHRLDETVTVKFHAVNARHFADVTSERLPGAGNFPAASSSTSTQSSNSPGFGGTKVRSPRFLNVPILSALPSRGLNHHASTLDRKRTRLNSSHVV